MIHSTLIVVLVITDFVLLYYLKNQSEALTRSIQQFSMLNCIQVHHVSTNLNGLKPQSHVLLQP